MKITLVRHPQTYDNVKKRMTGYYNNTRLTPIGKKQAEYTARHLAKQDFDIIYSSDLTRCRQLALKVKKLRPDIPLIVTKILRERDFGEYDRMLTKKYVLFESKAKDRNKLRPPNGESRNDAHKRINKFIESIKKKKHKHALIITHGGIKRIYLNKTLNLRLTYAHSHHVGISVIDPDTKRVYKLYDVSHLPKSLRTV